MKMILLLIETDRILFVRLLFGAYPPAGGLKPADALRTVPTAHCPAAVFTIAIYAPKRYPSDIALIAIGSGIKPELAVLILAGVVNAQH